MATPRIGHKLKTMTWDERRAQFVVAYDGDLEHAARAVGIDIEMAKEWEDSQWFKDGQEVKQSNARADRIRQGMGALPSIVADIMDVKAFITAVMLGEIRETQILKLRNDSGEEYFDEVKVPPKIAERLKAADLLLKAGGAYVERKEVKLEGGEKPIQVDAVDLQDRVAALGEAVEAIAQDDDAPQ